MRLVFSFLLLSLLLTQAALAIDLEVVPQIESAASPKTISTLAASPRWLQFFESKDNAGLLPALQSAQNGYDAALEKLSATMGRCRPKEIDAKWIDRAKAKFGSDHMKDVERDLRLAIGARYSSQVMSCEREDLQFALYAEANLIPLLLEFQQAEKEFLKKANADDRKIGNAIEAYISTLKNAKPTPLQLLTNQASSLKLIAKAAGVRKDVVDFVSTDPAFQTRFSLAAALKALKP